MSFWDWLRYSLSKYIMYIVVDQAHLICAFSCWAWHLWFFLTLRYHCILSSDTILHGHRKKQNVSDSECWLHWLIKHSFSTREDTFFILKQPHEMKYKTISLLLWKAQLCNNNGDLFMSEDKTFFFLHEYICFAYEISSGMISWDMFKYNKVKYLLGFVKSGKENFTPFPKYMMSNSKECHCFFLQSLFFFITWSDLQAFRSCEIKVCVGHLAQSEFFFPYHSFISPVKKIKPLLIVS